MNEIPKCPKCANAVRIRHETNNGQPLVSVTCDPCHLTFMAPDIDSAFRQLAKHRKEQNAT
jgi:hypothetical protein